MTTDLATGTPATDVTPAPVAPVATDAPQPGDLSPEDATALARVLAHVSADPNARAAVLQKLLGEAACRHIGVYPIPAGFKLSVVIPVYNEERWLGGLV